MAKKIVNSFYNDSYYGYEPLRKLPDNFLLNGEIRTNGDNDILLKVKSKFPMVDIPDVDNKNKSSVTVLFPNHIRNALKKYVRGQGFYFYDEPYRYVKHEIPGGYLYSGWGTGRRTKILPSDLPESYIHLKGYKKSGYLQTANVKDIAYKRSPFHNHTYKDDFLFLSYDKPFSGSDLFRAKDAFTEYVFGNDIVDVIFGVEKYSPDLREKTDCIKQQMVEQYNLYVDEMTRLDWPSIPEKIVRLEDLL